MVYLYETLNWRVEMDQILEKIKEEQSEFTTGLKKTAAFFHKDPKYFAVHSAAQIGQKAGVSETTVIRFTHKLGYAGFSDFQQDVQQLLLQRSSLMDYVETKKLDHENAPPIKGVMYHDVENIIRISERIDEADLEKAVTALASADRILVSGVRSSHALASWFAFALDLVIGNTRLFQNQMDDVLLRVNELTDKSVLVVFSFHRYAKETLRIAKLAKQQGVFVIAFTDSPFSPVTDFSDLSLCVQLNVKSTLDAAPVVVSLMNSIVSNLSLQNAEAFQARVKQFDALKADDFFQNG